MHRKASNDPVNARVTRSQAKRAKVPAAKDTKPVSLDFKEWNSQIQSPLFTTIPAEIRNEIFALALIPHEDENNAYATNSYWYRPGFRAPLRSNSDLLRTCRLVYLEAQAVLMHEAEHAFWFDRGPAGRSRDEAAQAFFDKLTEQNVRDLCAVRLFTQMYWLEGGMNLNRLMKHPKFSPEKMTITIRYSDWWFWESDTPLRMNEAWLRTFDGPASLKQLVVEFETMPRKKKEMDQIIARCKLHTLKLQDGKHLSAEHTPLREWSWKGPSKLNGQVWRHHPQGDEADYVVVVLTFVPMVQESKQLDPSL